MLNDVRTEIVFGLILQFFANHNVKLHVHYFVIIYILMTIQGRVRRSG